MRTNKTDCRMELKLMFLFLGMMLLVHNSFAAPATSSSEEDGDDWKAVIERLKLVSLTIDEFMELHKLIAEKGHVILKKVIDDPKVVEVKTEVMDKNVNQFKKLIDGFEQEQKEVDTKIYEFLDDFNDIMTKFDSEKTENLSTEAEVIQKSLKENGMDDLKNEINEHFKNFMKKLTTELDSYIAKLTEKEKKEETRLIDWFAKIKTTEDVEKQFDMFGDLFAGDSDESKEN